MDNPNSNDNAGLIIKVISKIVDAINREVSSRTGKLNLYADMLIVLVIALQIVTSGVEEIVRIIANVARGFAVPADHTTLLGELLILLVAFGFCLLFIYHTIKVEKLARNIRNNKK